MVDRKGQLFGEYRLIYLFGRGSFADVYLGQPEGSTSVAAQVAVKIFHTRLTQAGQEQFLEEAARLATLEHPHILSIKVFGVQERLPFLIIPFASQGSVGQRHADGVTLPAQTIVTYAGQIAGALQYAHERGIVHGELTPRNILLSEYNQLVVTDFALSSLTNISRSHQEPDLLNISDLITYMAPELLQGSASTPASDQYALALLLYEWLNGRPPFKGSFAEIATQHLFVRPTRLQEHSVMAMPALEEVLLRGLEKDPKRRYASIQAFYEAVREAQQSESLLSGRRTPLILSQPALAEHVPGLSLSSRSISDVQISLNKYWRVMGEYDQAVLQHPLDPIAYRNRGDAYFSLGEYTLAIADYTRAIELHPRYSQAYFNRAGVYYTLGKYREAIDDCTRVIALEPRDSAAYNNRGLAYAAINKYMQALDDYNQAIALEPLDSSYYYSRGVAYSYLEQFEQAIVDFTKVLEQHQEDVAALYNRGLARSSTGDYRGAIKDYSRALELDPTDAAIYNNRGGAYYALGEYEQALADCTKMIEMEPEDTTGYSNRANIAISRDDYAGALKDLDRALDLAPDDGVLHFNRGNVHYHLGDDLQALEDYNRAIELDEEGPRLYYNRAHCYRNLKEYEQALESYTRSIELDHKNFSAYNHRGNMEILLDRFPQAIESYTEAIKLNPRSAQAYYNRGRVYLAQDDFERAYPDILESWQLDDQQTSYGWLLEWARMCLEPGNLESADRLDRIGDLDPEDYLSDLCHAVADWLRGDYEQARERLDQALLIERREDIHFWLGVVYTSLERDPEAMAELATARIQGLPRPLFAVLRVFEEKRSDIFEGLITPMFQEWETM